MLMPDPVVFVVDDDEAVRLSVQMLLATAGLPSRLFATAEAYLAAYDASARGCLVLDVRMPGMSGLELQEQLRERGSRLPVLILTGHADVPMAVRAMKAGAFDFIEKPFAPDEVLARVREAIEFDRQLQTRFAARATQGMVNVDSLKSHPSAGSLTPAQLAVVPYLLEGLTEGEIAERVFRSKHTIHDHIKSIYAATGVRNRAQLVRLFLSEPATPTAP